MSKIYRNRFLLLRRLIQVLILVLFTCANIFSWKLLMGDLSTAYLFQKFYLSDPYAVLQISATGFIVGTDVLIGALIIFLFYSLIAGRAFCSWVCPLNMVTDFAWWLRKKLKLKQIDLKFPASRKLRYWIFALSIIVSAISGIAAFEIISPIAILHRGIIFGFGFGWAAIVIVFLFDLVILENGWCGYICPLGGFYSFISKFNLIKINHIKENCTLCMKCKKICPERQVLYIVGKESGYISSGECTNCGRCIEVCDDNSLKFSLNKYKK